MFPLVQVAITMPWNCGEKSKCSKKRQLEKLGNWLLEILSVSKEQTFQQKPKYRKLENNMTSFPAGVYVVVMPLTYSNVYRKRGKLRPIRV